MSAESKNFDNKTYVITLATLREKISNLETFSKLNKFGNIYQTSFPNGITKIYLQKLDKSNFINRDEASIILKAIKKIKKFRDAYISEVYYRSSFFSPNIQVKDQEVLISVKLNADKGQYENIASDNVKSTSKSLVKPTSYSIEENPQKFWIQLGSYKELKAQKILNEEFGLLPADKIRLQKSEGFIKYYLGIFSTKEEASLRLNSLQNNTGCQVLTERWDSEKKKIVMVKNL